MSQYQLLLLGSFQFLRGKDPVTGFRSEKERALLAYLASEAFHPHSRAALAGLLWPEQPEETAHNNLRVTLHRLRQVLGDSGSAHPLLVVSRESIQLNQTADIWIDESAFNELLANVKRHPHKKLATCPECMGWYAEAIVLYRGEFLQGIYPVDSLPFSEWALLKREYLHRQVLQGLYLLTTYYQRRGELDQALEYARRQLALEPWREEAHGQVMILLALRGERSAALDHYERCRQVLREELGVEPSEETRALYERILDSRKRRRHNLPLQTTPFLGRKAELNQVSEFLANPDCRLLTILGPGGMGKSRLAFQSAESQVYAFLQGVFLVQLSSVSSQEEIFHAIGGSLEFQFNPAKDPKTQLLDYLREKEMLLVLDNYEHLLGPGDPSAVRILEDLLEYAPGLHLLVTSRQRLNLSQEWVYVLQGLSYPQVGFIQDPEKYEAVQLFLQSANRSDPGFLLAEEDVPSVVRICQLLEGVPLAIELAASWVRLISPAEIVLEIESNLDFLASSYPDLPQRHRSLRGTFEHSFNLLTPKEQLALCRLSIFSGTFDRIAAEQVAGATLDVLKSLSDRSLLDHTRINHHGSHFRYRMHELIKQFSREKLGQDPVEVLRTKDRHRTFYMAFLNDRNKKVMGGMAQYQAGEEVSGEIENVRLALEQAIAQGNATELGHSINILMYFYEIHGLFNEAERVFGKISRRMEEVSKSGQAGAGAAGYYLGRAIMYHGWYYMRLARFDQAVDLFQKGAAISRQFGDLEGFGLALNSLGVIARGQGKYQQAKNYLQEALEVLSENRFPWAQAGAISNLGVLALLEGDLSLAVDLFHQSLDLFTQLDDDWGIANILGDLGEVALKQGNLELAEKRIRQALSIRQKLGQRWRIADLLNRLGEVAYRRQQYLLAKRDYYESITILQDYGERDRLASTLAGYGEICTMLGENAQARESLLASLKLAHEIGAEGTILRALLGLAGLFAKEGELERAVEILAAIDEHPALEHEDKKKVANLLSEMQEDLPSREFQTALETGKIRVLEDLVKAVLRSDRPSGYNSLDLGEFHGLRTHD